MQKLTFIFLCCIFVNIFSATANQRTINGKIITASGEPLSYTNVVLLNIADSTYISGTVSKENGTFSLQAPSEGLIKASHTGYISTYQATSSLQFINITLQPDTIMLSEVTVTASRPVTRLEGDAMVTTVRGTVLANTGSAIDVLGYIPGIINNQGAIEVIGKGAPTYYINGRKMRSMSELTMLRSEKIKKVELVTNPGARYNSSTDAVIRIYADRDQGEGFSLDNTFRIGYRDYLYGGDEASMNYRNGNLDIFSNLQYGYNKSKGHSFNRQNTWLQSTYQQDINLHSSAKNHIYDAQLGADYTISPTSSLGVYYKMTHSPIKKHTIYDATTFIDNALDENSVVDQRTSTRTTTHIVDGYYTARYGKWNFDAAFDFLWKDTDDKNNSTETIQNTANRQLTNHSDVDARMSAVEAHASHPWMKGNFKFGAEFTASRRNDNFLNAENILKENQILLKEQNTSCYVETAQRLGKITLQLGLRYEHIESRYHEFGKYVPEQSNVYNKLLPSAALVMPMGKSMLQLTYSRKYRRPLYSQLSSSISYVNRYLYQSGNPLLQTEYSHNISANYRLGDFMLMSNYALIDQKIISSISQFGNNSNVTLLRKENSPYNLHELQVLASYSPQFGRYYGVLTAGVLAQFYKIEYRGIERTMNNPIGLVQWRNIYILPHNTRIDAALIWRTNGNGENVDMGSTWQINAGITHFLNRHWQLKLNVNDIFNTARKTHNTVYSDCRSIYLQKYITARNVELQVRYMFNTTNTKYKGKGAGNNEKSRL